LATYGASGMLMGVLMILFNANLLVDHSLRTGIEINIDSAESFLTDSISLNIIYAMIFVVSIKILASLIP
jgi:hypothetical protein